MNCKSHENAPEREWLPLKTGTLKLHPYCKKCGVVKDVSSDRGKKLGFFVNVLHDLKARLERRGYRITQAQMRLILKEFEEKGYADTYSNSYSTQKEAFVRIVRKYVRVSEDLIRHFL